MITTLYWVSEHDFGEDEGTVTCGLIVDAAKPPSDSVPSPHCPIKCGIDNHRMRPVTYAEYVEIVGEES